jgi:hypothetical protein
LPGLSYVDYILFQGPYILSVNLPDLIQAKGLSFSSVMTSASVPVLTALNNTNGDSYIYFEGLNEMTLWPCPNLATGIVLYCANVTTSRGCVMNGIIS